MTLNIFRKFLKSKLEIAKDSLKQVLKVLFKIISNPKLLISIPVVFVKEPKETTQKLLSIFRKTILNAFLLFIISIILLILKFYQLLVVVGTILLMARLITPGIVLVILGYSLLYPIHAFEFYQDIETLKVRYKGLGEIVQQNFRIFFIMFNLVAFPIFYFAWLYTFFGITSPSDKLIEGIGTYSKALYFSVTTFVGIGSGEFSPTPNARILVSFESIMGYLYLGFLVAIIMSLFRKGTVDYKTREVEKDLKRNKPPKRASNEK